MSLAEVKEIIDEYRRGELPLEEAARRLAAAHFTEGWGLFLDEALPPSAESEALLALQRRTLELVSRWIVSQRGPDGSGTA